MKVEARAKVHPSEDPRKVVEAMNNIFPSLDFEVTDDSVEGESTDLKSLENFKNMLGLQAIRDSARRELKKGRREDIVRFFLNKQAVTVSKISFSDGETPLGPIEVSLEAEDLDKLIDYLAPARKDRSSNK